jgi:hypothetical protein
MLKPSPPSETWRNHQMNRFRSQPGMSWYLESDWILKAGWRAVMISVLPRRTLRFAARCSSNFCKGSRWNPSGHRMIRWMSRPCATLFRLRFDTARRPNPCRPRNDTCTRQGVCYCRYSFGITHPMRDNLGGKQCTLGKTTSQSFWLPKTMLFCEILQNGAVRQIRPTCIKPINRCKLIRKEPELHC